MRRRRLPAIQLVGLGAMCGSLCACDATSEPPPRIRERDMLVLLLDYRANINQKRPGDGMDALAIACLEGQLTIVDMLVARNAAVEAQDLSYAIGAGHVEVARRLLDAGADPAWTFNGRTMTQVVRESPGKTRGDLESLLQRYAVRRNQSHMPNAAPPGR